MPTIVELVTDASSIESGTLIEHLQNIETGTGKVIEHTIYVEAITANLPMNILLADITNQTLNVDVKNEVLQVDLNLNTEPLVADIKNQVLEVELNDYTH
jgi:hypothetical protein